MPQHDLHALAAQAQAAAERSYAPYSRFHVGAALLLTNGEVITGTNVENASYRLSCCAEQAAVAAAVSRFGAEVRIAAVAVANRAAVSCSPCGACRQTLAEFAAPETPVQYPGADGQPQVRTLAELLPSSFALDPAPGAKS